MPTWDALTFSAICSVLHVHVRRNRYAIVDLLRLDALHTPDLSTQDAIRRVSPGQKFFTAVPLLLPLPPPANSACSVAPQAPNQCFWCQDMALYRLCDRWWSLVTQTQSNLLRIAVCDLMKLQQRESKHSLLLDIKVQTLQLLR